MSVSWMKTGAASVKAAVEAEQAKELQQETKGKMFRFSIRDKEEARITFIDGDLSPEGFLVPNRFYEHSQWDQLNGTYLNNVCPEKTMPEAGHKCPLCAAGDRAVLVAVMTVIVAEVKSKAGKVYKDQRRLLVAKPLSMEMLTKIAVKRGGLAGCTFDVTRMGDKSAAIGSMFDFVEKNPISALQSNFVEEVTMPDGSKKMQTYFVPADYEKEIVFRTPEEMLKLGIGAKSFGGGSSMSPGGQQSGKTDYSKDL